MSYCRFSSDDHQCDVYVYADCRGGYTTHVAARRRVFNEPLPPEIEVSSDTIDAWLARHRSVMAMCERSEMVPIGLPHDGETFEHATASECAEHMAYLLELGYRVPQDVIRILQEEALGMQDKIE